MKDTIVIKIAGFPLRVSALLLPVVVVFLFYILRENKYSFYVRIIEEDGVVEYLTAATYLISSIIAASISVSFFKTKNNFLCFSYAFLAAGLFFICGEEISWGQRILGISSPDYFLQHNAQQEFNLHNLEVVEKYLLHNSFILIGAYGTFSWILLKTNKGDSLEYPYFIPEWYLSSYFFAVLFFYVYRDYVMPYYNFLELTTREQEPSEFILSMGFFLFLLINRFRQIQDFRLPEPGLLSATKYPK